MAFKSVSMAECIDMITVVGRQLPVSPDCGDDPDLRALHDKIKSGVIRMLSDLLRAASFQERGCLAPINALILEFLRRTLLRQDDDDEDEEDEEDEEKDTHHDHAEDSAPCASLLHWAVLVDEQAFTEQDLCFLLSRYPKIVMQSIKIEDFDPAYDIRLPILPIHLICAQATPNMRVASKLIRTAPSILDSTRRPSALSVAAEFCESKPFVQFLLQRCGGKKALMTRDSLRGRVPLDYACSNESDEIFDLMLNVCPEAAFVKDTDIEGYPILTAAALNDLPRIQKLWKVAERYFIADTTKNMNEEKVWVSLFGFNHVVRPRKSYDTSSTLHWVCEKMRTHPRFRQNPAKHTNDALSAALKAWSPSVVVSPSQLLDILGVCPGYPNFRYGAEFYPLHSFCQGSFNNAVQLLPYLTRLMLLYPHALTMDIPDYGTPLAVLCANYKLGFHLILRQVLGAAPEAANIACRTWASYSTKPAQLPIKTLVQTVATELRLCVSGEPNTCLREMELALRMLRSATQAESVYCDLRQFCHASRPAAFFGHVFPSAVDVNETKRLWYLLHRTVLRTLVHKTPPASPSSSSSAPATSSGYAFQHQQQQSVVAIDNTPSAAGARATAAEDAEWQRRELVRCEESLRELNYEARKEALFLAFRAGTAGGTYNIFAELAYIEEGALLRAVVSFL